MSVPLLIRKVDLNRYHRSVSRSLEIGISTADIRIQSEQELQFQSYKHVFKLFKSAKPIKRHLTCQTPNPPTHQSMVTLHILHMSKTLHKGNVMPI